MFVLRNLRSDDHAQRDRILQFLRSNPAEGIRERPEPQLALAQKAGLVLVIEDEDGICGCSFVYKFSEGESVFSEVGTMLVTRRGYRLQQILAQLHIVQLSLEEYFDVSNMIFAVVGRGTASEHILKNHTGMKEWTAPAPLINLRTCAGTPFNPDKQCLLAGSSCVQKAFSDLRRLYNGKNEFRTPNSNGSLKVELGWFNDDVLSAKPQAVTVGDKK